jgi:hypothetical protein
VKDFLPQVHILNDLLLSVRVLDSHELLPHLLQQLVGLGSGTDDSEFLTTYLIQVNLAQTNRVCLRIAPIHVREKTPLAE